MSRLVPGRGNPHANAVILGEAPGADEDRLGQPFVGRSGQLLSRVLAECGVDEETDVWITNVIKRRPPGNETPSWEAVDAAREDVLREIMETGARLVLGVGNVPLYCMTSQRGGITTTRGAWQRLAFINAIENDGTDFVVEFLPTVHPAYVSRDEAERLPMLREDIAKFAHELRKLTKVGAPTKGTEEVKMSFFDEYKEIGGNWVSADEKQVLMDNGIPFEIQDVVEDDHNQYGPRFVAHVLLPNPETGENEERVIGFPKGTVESRDRMLSQMQEYLERDGDKEPVMVKLEKVGRSIIIRNAGATE